MLRSWLLGMVVGMFAGCGSSSSAPDNPAPVNNPPAGAAACPLRDATMAVTDTPTGVAMDFTTTGDVADLRSRVQHMAIMRNRGMGRGGGMGGGMRGGGMMGGMGGMVASRATVEEIPRGARLVLTPENPDDLAALRQQARQQVAMMRQGECPLIAQPVGPSQPKGT